MKITNTYLKQIIKEEIQDLFNESNPLEEANFNQGSEEARHMLEILTSNLNWNELKFVRDRIDVFLQDEEDEAAEAAADMVDYGDQEDYDGY